MQEETNWVLLGLSLVAIGFHGLWMFEIHKRLDQSGVATRMLWKEIKKLKKELKNLKNS